MLENKLLPCPFCGRKAQIEYERNWQNKYIYYVRCITSNCYGHAIKPAFFDNKEQAVKSWNRRADKGED